MKKVLLDSNIIIYATKPGFDFLRDHIRGNICYISIISKIEVLGYHKIKIQEQEKLQAFFEIAPVIRLNDVISDKAIELRKSYNLTLGDAIIASSAIIHNLTLTTRNINDFKKLPDLSVLNPFQDS